MNKQDIDWLKSQSPHPNDQEILKECIPATKRQLIWNILNLCQQMRQDVERLRAMSMFNQDYADSTSPSTEPAA